MLKFQQTEKVMKQKTDNLGECPLFRGIAERDIEAMLGCLGASERRYKKGSMVFAEGDPALYLGVVLMGRVQIERVDYYGNRSILAVIGTPQLFGESFVCAGLPQLPVSVVATDDTEVILLDAKKITQPCSNACAFHSRMIFNLLNIVAQKNLVFHRKLEITSKRTTRDKLMTYLLFEAKGHMSNTFTIPYDRQELADYLEVERSGLSAEIGKLRRENVLECRKSTFSLVGFNGFE